MLPSPWMVGRMVSMSALGVLAVHSLAACSDDAISTSTSGSTSVVSSSTSTGSTSTGTGGAGGDGGAPGTPTIAFVDLSGAVDLTPDGSVALLEDQGSPTVDAYFYDTTTNVRTKKT